MSRDVVEKYQKAAATRATTAPLKCIVRPTRARNKDKQEKKDVQQAKEVKKISDNKLKTADRVVRRLRKIEKRREI